MAGPASLPVLHADQRLGHYLVPFFEVGSALHEERLSNVHEAEELLAAVGTEALDEVVVSEIFDDRPRCVLAQLFELVGFLDGRLGFFFLLFGRVFTLQRLPGKPAVATHGASDVARVGQALAPRVQWHAGIGPCGSAGHSTTGADIAAR